VLFHQRFWAGIADGSITLTFRRWKRAQVVAGLQKRTPAGRIEVDAVEVVDPAVITDRDAIRAGFTDADHLRSELRGTPDLPTYRIEFHLLDEPDPREVLASDDDLTPTDLAELRTRLARLDRASKRGPWTGETLAIIAARSAIRAGDLAADLGRETAPFKLDVRKLKALGLTRSLEVGYELSPRGRAYLATLEAAG